jgi:hypothetical protein
VKKQVDACFRYPVWGMSMPALLVVFETQERKSSVNTLAQYSCLDFIAFHSALLTFLGFNKNERILYGHALLSHVLLGLCVCRLITWISRYLHTCARTRTHTHIYTVCIYTRTRTAFICVGGWVNDSALDVMMRLSSTHAVDTVTTVCSRLLNFPFSPKFGAREIFAN